MNDEEIEKFVLDFIDDEKITQDFVEAVNELQADSDGGNIDPPEIVPPRFERWLLIFKIFFRRRKRKSTTIKSTRQGVKRSVPCARLSLC